MKCIGEKCIKCSFYDDIAICNGDKEKPKIVIPNKDICIYTEKIRKELQTSIHNVQQYLDELKEQLKYFQGGNNK